MPATLITGYVNPDLDATASIIAYAELLTKLGLDVRPGILGEPHDEAKYLLKRLGIACPPKLNNTDAYEKVILVDASDLIGLEGRVAPEKIIEIIDHRKINEANKFPNAKIQIELVGAAATLVAEKFLENKTVISEDSAALIYGAIISNTLNFKSSTTTDRDLEAAKWLNEIAQLPANFAYDLFMAKSDLRGRKLSERIKSDFAWFILENNRVSIAQLEIIGAEKLLQERNQEICACLEELKNELNLDYIFLNLIELENAKTYLIAPDLATQKLLEKALAVRFDKNLAIRQNLIMRKQIVPFLKAALE